MTRSLLQDYRDSLRHPEFWIYATWLELVTKYRRSKLGILWALMPPFLYAFGVGWFFGMLQGVDPIEFIPHLGIGYVVFRLVTVAISESTTACATHASFIMDGRTRLTDYVLRVVAKALFYFVLATPVITIALVMSGSVSLAGVMVAVPALLIVLLNIAWIGAVVAVVGARFPDVSQLVGSALMFSFLFTLIIWQASQVPLGTMRGTIARANPLFHFVEIVRAPLLEQPLERLSIVYVAVLTVLGWGVAAWVYRRYAKFVPMWV